MKLSFNKKQIINQSFLHTCMNKSKNNKLEKRNLKDIQ